jgi:hypothetical protein
MIHGTVADDWVIITPPHPGNYGLIGTFRLLLTNRRSYQTGLPTVMELTTIPD